MSHKTFPGMQDCEKLDLTEVNLLFPTAYAEWQRSAGHWPDHVWVIDSDSNLWWAGYGRDNETGETVLSMVCEWDADQRTWFYAAHTHDQNHPEYGQHP